MKRFLSVAGVGVCVLIGWLVISSQMTRAEADPYPYQKPSHDPFDPMKKDRDIQFHEGRVNRDPGGAIGWAMLGGAYLARAREQDSYADAIKAESAARRSLSLRTKGNLGGQTRLVNSLLQEHRFLDALAADESALKFWGPEPELNELHADIFIEVGRYGDAAKVIAAHPDAFEFPSGKAVIAHLEMMTGKQEEALALLDKAYADVDANAGATDENLAWFKEKIGEELVSLGRLEDARQAYAMAVAQYPKGYKAYAGLARLAAARGDWGEAIRYGTASNVIAPMPDILALVGDAYAQSGDGKSASRMYADVVALAGKPSGPANGLHEFAGATGGHGHTLDRQYAMFCADHDRDLDGAYACALRELQARRDAYAFDTLAWVCLKRGDKVEASEAIDRALKTGIRDAKVFYHAGLIAATNSSDAAKFLNLALASPGVLSKIETENANLMLARSKP